MTKKKIFFRLAVGKKNFFPRDWGKPQTQILGKLRKIHTTMLCEALVLKVFKTYFLLRKVRLA